MSKSRSFGCQLSDVDQKKQNNMIQPNQRNESVPRQLSHLFVLLSHVGYWTDKDKFLRNTQLNR